MKNLHKVSRLLHLLAAFLLLGSSTSLGQDTSASYNGLALTPPMGWNSWNTFYCNINEDKIKAAADSLVSTGMKDAGYEYIVVDDCWQIGRGADSVIIIDTVNFPSGIKALADYIHSKGLKFGIYSDAGTLTCQGRPGSYNYEAIDAKTYAGWGVDYVKFDWCYTGSEVAQTQYTKMSNALLSTGRPIVFSICEWGLSSPWLWAQQVGNLWRCTYDIQACWNCTQTWGGMGWTLIIDKMAGLSRYSGPGHWNDPDMLEVGNAGLTNVENKSHFSMWCMLAAPLMAGNDIRSMTTATKSILTNTEMIAVDQDSLGIQGRRIVYENGLEVWCKPLKDSSRAVALFNRTSYKATMSFRLNQIGLVAGKASVRDLWEHEDLDTVTDSFQVVVPARGIVVVKVKGDLDTAYSITIDKDTITVNDGNSSVISVNIEPFYTETSATSTKTSVATVIALGVNQYRVMGQDTGTCQVIITSADGLLVDTCTVTVTASQIPSPWMFNIIGETTASGFYDTDTFSIAARGSDIGGTSDQCGYIKRVVSGNQSLSCRLLSQASESTSAKSGLMFRDLLAVGSPFVMLAATPAGELILEWRLTSGGTAVSSVVGSATCPVYLKLEKVNLSVAAFTSKDGVTWDTVGTVTLTSFNTNYFVGMEAVSCNTTQYVESAFDNVTLKSITSTDAPLCPASAGTNTLAITVSPNPAGSNNISVAIQDARSNENIDVSIYTMAGTLIHSGTSTVQGGTIDLEISSSEFTSGVYTLVVKDSRNRTGEAKLVVNKMR